MTVCSTPHSSAPRRRHRQPQPHRFRDARQRVEGRIAAGDEGLVDRLAAQAGFSRQFARFHRARDLAEGRRDQIGVAVFQYRFVIGRALLGRLQILLDLERLWTSKG